MDILLFIVGVALVLVGADLFTDGASRLARALKVSELVIGLTIVSLGTSAPELFTSFVSALKGASGLALGNVIGSNVFNTTLIVGCSAAVAVIPVLPITIKRDVPFAVLATLALCVFCIDGTISRIDSIALLVGFVVFMVLTIRGGKKDVAVQPVADEKLSGWRYVQFAAFIVGGLAMLIFGSNLFVDSASSIARSLRVNETFIGITIVAGGTSLPELATSIVAARKGQSGIAIGNVIGSNVFNILFVLGLSGLVTPISVADISIVDYTVLVGTILLVWWLSYTKYEINRREGWSLIAVYAVYLAYLIYRA
ncbi:MAG: calcium/sodium antiporter [Alloprevotella sp.]|nr:calcium/sodium antiporter [Alloprevotella sp.]